MRAPTAVTLALTILVSCSPARGPSDGRVPGPAALGSSSAQALPGPLRSWTGGHLRVEEQLRLGGIRGDALGFTSWDHYVGWIEGDEPEHLGSVVVYDLDAKTARTVVRRLAPHGILDKISGAGTTLLFTEVPEVPSDATDFGGSWSAYVTDITTGARRLVATGVSQTGLPILGYPSG